LVLVSFRLAFQMPDKTLVFIEENEIQEKREWQFAKSGCSLCANQGEAV